MWADKVASDEKNRIIEAHENVCAVRESDSLVCDYVVITKYFTGTVAGRWKRTRVSFHVQSLRSFFRYASSRGWCVAGIAESIDAPRLYCRAALKDRTNSVRCKFRVLKDRTTISSCT